MAHFHVHRLKHGNDLVLDLQADLLDTLETRVVAPLITIDEIATAFIRLSPRLTIDGQSYLVSVPSMAAIPRHMLGEDVADCSARRDEFVAATDFLFQGF